MKRFDCLKLVAAEAKDALVVSSAGAMTLEWNVLRPGDGNFRVRTLGLCSSIALGMALGLPDRKIIALDGDGSLLMNLCSLPTMARMHPNHLIHIVFDNEVYGTTGNQPTISNVVPLDKVAKAAGYVNVERVLDRDDLVYEFKEILKKDGPSMVLVKVNEFAEDAGRIVLDPPEITKRFMKAIES